MSNTAPEVPAQPTNPTNDPSQGTATTPSFLGNLEARFDAVEDKLDALLAHLRGQNNPPQA